jgi:hypothetical protein
VNVVPTPLLEECDDHTHTPEMGTWESSRTPEISEFDYRGQNTSPWGVMHVIGKILKCRCRKWPRMSHLDICNTSYGKKKGRESNWQFDPGVCKWNATHRWKALNKSYKFFSDLIPIWGLSKELWTHKVPTVRTGTILGLLLGSPETKAIRMWVPRNNAENTIWGKVVASPESGPWWVSWIQSCPWLVLAPRVL